MTDQLGDRELEGGAATAGVAGSQAATEPDRAVTKEDIRVRMAAIDEEIWPSKPTRPKEVRPGVGDTFSDFTKSGKEPMTDLLNQIYADFNKRNGTNVPVPK